MPSIREITAAPASTTRPVGPSPPATAPSLSAARRDPRYQRHRRHAHADQARANGGARLLFNGGYQSPNRLVSGEAGQPRSPLCAPRRSVLHHRPAHQESQYGRPKHAVNAVAAALDPFGTSLFAVGGQANQYVFEHTWRNDVPVLTVTHNIDAPGAVPEPGTLAMVGIALVLIATKWSRRFRLPYTPFRRHLTDPNNLQVSEPRPTE